MFGYWEAAATANAAAGSAEMARQNAQDAIQQATTHRLMQKHHGQWLQILVKRGGRGSTVWFKDHTRPPEVAPAK